MITYIVERRAECSAAARREERDAARFRALILLLFAVEMPFLSQTDIIGASLLVTVCLQLPFPFREIDIGGANLLVTVPLQLPFPFTD